MSATNENGNSQHVRINALAAFIAQRLDDLGITRSQFSQETGMSRSTLYRLLGPEPPERVDGERLSRMAEVLQVDKSQLEALWDGSIWAQAADADRENLVRSFVLATGDLTLDELKEALDVARAAARMVTRARGDVGARP
jgi:transcriptional regulator with XRE-family HTH domain